MIETSARWAGSTQLRTIEPGTAEHRRWVDLAADAYPIVKLETTAARDAFFEQERDRSLREPEQRLVGAYRDGLLVGGMRVFDFRMCVRGVRMFAGGLGSVAVGLEQKGRGIARDLVRGFIDEYRERGAALALLHPFRPSFYRKLGFGYGAKLQQYTIAPDALPAGGLRERVRRLTPRDMDAFLAAYERVAVHTNGLIRRDPWRAAAWLANATLLTFGYFDADDLRGYLSVEVRLGESGSANRNALYAHELIYETPAALAGLLAFVHSQRDQYATLIINTQDPDFHFVPSDPRNGSDRLLYPPAVHETDAQGLGVMYRVLDVPQLIGAAHDCTFGDLDACLRVDLIDTFVPENTGAYAVRFAAGRPRLDAPSSSTDVDLAIEVADFSALIMGSVRLRSLVAYGRAFLSKPDWLRRLDAAFHTQPPQCLTRF